MQRFCCGLFCDGDLLRSLSRQEVYLETTPTRALKTLAALAEELNNPRLLFAYGAYQMTYLFILQRVVNLVLPHAVRPGIYVGAAAQAVRADGTRAAVGLGWRRFSKTPCGGACRRSPNRRAGESDWTTKARGARPPARNASLSEQGWRMHGLVTSPRTSWLMKKTRKETVVSVMYGHTSKLT